VLLLAPLLRLADALDRSRDQRVEAITCEVRNGTVHVVQSPHDTGLEQWAVEGAALFFRQAYERAIVGAREQT
jgi:exopolyphosphatase / guanosine-5'-triphosphate,3'-diphosphate pyrophosphatase